MSQSQINEIARGINTITDETIKVRDDLATLRREAEASFDDVYRKLGAKSHSPIFYGGGGALDEARDLLTTEQKRMASKFDGKYSGELTGGDAVMLANEWFRLSTKLQCSRWRADHHEIAPKFAKLSDALGVETKAALQEDTAGEGGNLVPTIVEPEVQRLVFDAADIFSRCRRVEMRSKVHKVPTEDQACSVNWVDEEGTLSGGEPTFAQTTLTAEKIAGRATMSIELVEDSAPGLLNYLLEVFTEKMAGELDFQAVMGDGSGPQITGIYNGSGINALTSGTAAGRSLTYPLMVSTFIEASEKSTRMDGVWLASPKGYGAILSLTDTQGMPIVNFGSVPNAPAGTFLGRPIVVSARLAGLTGLDVTSTAASIIFGPLSKMLAGTRTGMRWEVTDQVNWSTYQMDARLVGRYAGAPSVPAAFTYLGQVSI